MRMTRSAYSLHKNINVDILRNCATCNLPNSCTERPQLNTRVLISHSDRRRTKHNYGEYLRLCFCVNYKPTSSSACVHKHLVFLRHTRSDPIRQANSSLRNRVYECELFFAPLITKFASSRYVVSIAHLRNFWVAICFICVRETFHRSCWKDTF
jgi:hypothetical protein